MKRVAATIVTALMLSGSLLIAPASAEQAAPEPAAPCQASELIAVTQGLSKHIDFLYAQQAVADQTIESQADKLAAQDVKLQRRTDKIAGQRATIDRLRAKLRNR